MANLIDLRSDTVTRPTKEMKAAMMAAELGDDVFGDDPTINKLQEKVAAMFGKEAALYVPSGTMSNQICIKAHTQPGDEMICEETCHIYNWEAGGPAVLSGVTARTLKGDYGLLDLSQLTDKIRPGNDHYVRTRMVALENTHNRGGGRVYPLEKIKAISGWARGNGLIMHLDGARIWNAIVVTGISANVWAEQFDSLSVCFSKGLGAPVGSALIGTKDFVAKAKRVRKLFGGSMRQAGVIASGALYAIENHIERLKEDHANAQIIAQGIRESRVLKLECDPIETNLIWFQIDPIFGSSKEVAQQLREHSILAHVSGPQLMRVCTHLDVNRSQCERVAEVFRTLFK